MAARVRSERRGSGGSGAVVIFHFVRAIFADGRASARFVASRASDSFVIVALILRHARVGVIGGVGMAVVVVVVVFHWVTMLVLVGIVGVLF